MAESFFATLECELLDRVRFRSQSEARIAIFDFIEVFYNPRRRHSDISRQSSSNVRRQSEPGFARVDLLRAESLNDFRKEIRHNQPCARGRSQALRCPSKRGSSTQPRARRPVRYLPHAGARAVQHDPGRTRLACSTGLARRALRGGLRPRPRPPLLPLRRTTPTCRRRSPTRSMPV